MSMLRHTISFSGGTCGTHSNAAFLDDARVLPFDVFSGRFRSFECRETAVDVHCPHQPAPRIAAFLDRATRAYVVMLPSCCEPGLKEYDDVINIKICICV